MRKDEKKEKRYRLEVSEAQLKMIQVALESYFRIRYHQFLDLADDLVFANYDRKEDPDRSEFTRRIDRRNETYDLLNAAGNAAMPIWMRVKKTDQCMIAEDIWAVIRHELYKKENGSEENVMDVRSYSPILISGEEPVKLEEIDG